MNGARQSSKDTTRGGWRSEFYIDRVCRQDRQINRKYNNILKNGEITVWKIEKVKCIPSS